MKILLAEDDAIARKAIAAGLMSDGYEVELAEDGEKAFSIAHQIHPDLIISDILMPNMDGFSLCQAVRSDEELNDVPVVFYSSTFLDPEDEELAQQVGASGFIVKDSDPEVFHSKLHDIIESEKNHTPPSFNRDPALHDKARRMHLITLVGKLHKKMIELEKDKHALHESRRFLDHIVTTIPDVVFVLHLPELELSYIAPQAKRLLGYPGEELMARPDSWRELIYEADRARVEREIQTAMTSGESSIITCRMYKKTGEVRWIEGRLSPGFDSEGRAVELFGSLTDVTERFDRESRIQKSERHLNTLLSNLPGMAYRCENQRDWNMEFVSDGVKGLSGYTRNEVEQSRVISYADLIHPDDQDMVWNEVQQALKEKRQFSLIYRILHKDGSTRWVWERGIGVDGEEDDEQHIEGFVSDITLRKEAEEKLIDSEQRFRILFEMMESGMSVHELVYDEDGTVCDYRFLEVNPAFERLTGLKAEAVIGRTAREVLPGLEDEWITDYINVAQTGKSNSFIRYAEPLDRYFQVIAYQTQKDQFATIFTDVSEQRKAEKQVRSLARFPEENPNPVIRIDAKGKILYENPATKKLLEHCSDECPALYSTLINFSARVLKSNTSVREDIAVGEYFYSFVATPFKEAGYVNIYGRDITSRVIAAQQLERTNRVLRTLSQSNRGIIHASSEIELLRNVCGVLATDGNYPFVWAAYSTTGRLVPQVFCGDSEKSMQRWLDELGKLDLQSSYFSGLYDNSATLLFTDLEMGEWTKQQKKIIRKSDVSALLMLPLRYRNKLFGVFGIFSTNRDMFDESELSILHEMAGDVAYGIESQRTHVAHEKSMERVQNTMLQTIEAVSMTLEKRDPYTAGHQQRVVQLAVAIARDMGFDEKRIEGLGLAALVHDIGKIHVPAEILNRPGRLSESEYSIIKAHPQVGYEILKNVEFDWPIADIVLQHHERCDGSGYPNGLVREQIILEARILAVADVVDAISTHRPYRPGLGVDRALAEIESGRGLIYDETVVDTCLRLFREKDFAWDETDSLHFV